MLNTKEKTTPLQTRLEHRSFYVFRNMPVSNLFDDTTSYLNYPHRSRQQYPLVWCLLHLLGFLFRLLEENGIFNVSSDFNRIDRVYQRFRCDFD